MNGYDQQLKELLAQCARKKKLEASAAELRRQRDTYAARAEELKEAMWEEQADVDRLDREFIPKRNRNVYQWI